MALPKGFLLTDFCPPPFWLQGLAAEMWFRDDPALRASNFGVALTFLVLVLVSV